MMQIAEDQCRYVWMCPTLLIANVPTTPSPFTILIVTCGDKLRAHYRHYSQNLLPVAEQVKHKDPEHQLGA